MVLNTNQVQQENSHGKIRVGGGLLYTRNYLASWGLDTETNRIYMGVQDIIPPYYNGSRVSDRGQIYILRSPITGTQHGGDDDDDDSVDRDPRLGPRFVVTTDCAVYLRRSGAAESSGVTRPNIISQ